jgi:hypothetical protein
MDRPRDRGESSLEMLGQLIAKGAVTAYPAKPQLRLPRR